MAREWMPFREAVDYVAAACKCGAEAARDQLKKYFQTGEIRTGARRFEGTADRGGFLPATNAVLPPKFWEFAKFVAVGDATMAAAEWVDDQWLPQDPGWVTLSSPFGYDARGLLVSREDLLSVWPEVVRAANPEAARAAALDDRPSNGGGRPRGTGYDKQDAPHVREVLDRVAQGKAKSYTEAATEIVRRDERAVAGAGTFDAKVKRLVAGAKKQAQNKAD